MRTPFLLGKQRVPGIWRYLMPEDMLDRPFPAESKSTCNACPKVKEENFHPDYRCCTYHPKVVNVLLGLALEDPVTAPLIERMIADRFATPEGLLAVPSQVRDSLRLTASTLDSRDGVVVCRFLDVERRRCGIHAYRDSICATFFCKHDRDELGREFWRRLQAAVGQSEAALSQWVMGELGIDVAAYMESFNSLRSEIARPGTMPADGWSPEALRLLWGSWYGREAEFYLACAGLARARKASLMEIAEAQHILTPRVYDQAFMDSLPRDLQVEMAESGPIGGEPMAVSSLWYQAVLAHRNLWQPQGPT